MTDNFELRDGQYHCTNPNCDWWVPEGMEYLAEDHDCLRDIPTQAEVEERLEELRGEDKSPTTEELEDRLAEAIKRLENGESAEDLDDIFGTDNDDEDALIIDGVDLSEYDADDLLDAEEAEEMIREGLDERAEEVLDGEEGDDWIPIEELVDE